MFDIRQRGSTVGREVIGGVTTFAAMSYIIFVQAAVLGFGAKMDVGGVIMATCLSAAAACVLMGLLANYPIALAPGMGENFFFAFTIVPAAATWGLGASWPMALAMTAVSGVLFLGLAFFGFRSKVLNAIPDSLKSGIAAGIGLFIAVIGFNMGNLVETGGALVRLPKLSGNPVAWLTLIGLAIVLILMALRLRGAILLSILITAGAALLMGRLGWVAFEWCGNPVAHPEGLGATAGAVLGGMTDLWQACRSHLVEVITFVFVLLFMDLFDTIGTLVGVAKRAGLMTPDGRLPRAEHALVADAAGTIIGAGLGTSTVTSYIESITGITAGARTGLAAIVSGVLMAAAIFFIPLARMIGQGIPVDVGGATVFKNPMIAPALIVVGSMMLRTLREIDWDDATEFIPAFLTMVAMPMSFSIATGIAVGLVSYALGKLATGRWRQCPALVYVFAALMVARYVLAPDM
ncbi:MAG: NCS2 family permease [Planctomycetaceae bacterium]|nr:NCS2 family permease [Planctomycetaceae bacterium]